MLKWFLINNFGMKKARFLKRVTPVVETIIFYNLKTFILRPHESDSQKLAFNYAAFLTHQMSHTDNCTINFGLGFIKQFSKFFHYRDRSNSNLCIKEDYILGVKYKNFSISVRRESIVTVT